MITLKDFMETVNYRITEGSEYCWQCYGPDAYRLDSWNQEQDGHSVSIVFDTRTQTVYEACAYDYSRNRAYRMINPDFKQAHTNESREKNVLENQAWDDVNYTDIDVEEDFLEKAQAIVAGEDYDTRVSVPLTVPDDVLFELMKKAHEQDITLNELVEQVLWEAIRSEKSREEVLDSQYPDGDGYWRDEDGWDEIAEDHSGDSEDDLDVKNKGKKKKGKK